MREEITVFSGEKGLGYPCRHPAVRHIDTAFLAIFTDQRTVPGKHARRGHRMEVSQFAAVRHVMEQPCGIDGDREARYGHSAHHDNACHGEPTFR